MRKNGKVGHSLKLGRVGLVVVLRVRGVFQVGRTESDKVVKTILANRGVNGGADLGRFRDIDASGEVLQEGLLVDRSSVQVDRANTNIGNGGGLSVVSYRSAVLLLVLCAEKCQAIGCKTIHSPHLTVSTCPPMALVLATGEVM